MRTCPLLWLVVSAAGLAQTQYPYPEELRIESLVEELDWRHLHEAPGVPIPLSVRVYVDEYDRPPRNDISVSFQVVSGHACVAYSGLSLRTDRRGVVVASVVLGELPRDGPEREDVLVRASIVGVPEQRVEFTLDNRRPSLRILRVIDAVTGETVTSSLPRIGVGEPLLVEVETTPKEAVSAEGGRGKADLLPEKRYLSDDAGRAWFAIVPTEPGAITIRFWSDHEGRSVHLTVVDSPPTPAETWRLRVVSGDRQFGAQGMPLVHPIVVRATDASGAPLAGHRLTVTPLTAGGKAEPTAPITDADGSAQIAYTCAENDHVGAFRVSVEDAGAGRACAVVVLPPEVRLVVESPPGSGQYEPNPRGLLTYDQWKHFSQPGMNITPPPPPTPVQFLELRCCDLGETATAEFVAYGRDDKPLPPTDRDLIPPRTEVELHAVERDERFTRYRSGPLVAVWRPEGLTGVEKQELQASGTIQGWRPFLAGDEGVVFRGPIEAGRK